MGEQEILRLKRKCNQLIEITLQLEDELKEKEKKINSLKLENEAIKARISETLVQKQQENEQTKFDTNISVIEEIPVVDRESQIEEIMLLRQQENFSIAHTKILLMLHQLSTQIEASPSKNREIVVRNLSGKAKLIEAIENLGGNIFRGIVFGVVMLLMSIAATVLLNEETRNMLFELVRDSIG